MTAICARLAASATRVKSLRKGSVDGVLTAAAVGAGAGAVAAAAVMMSLIGERSWVDDEVDDAAAVEDVVVERPVPAALGTFIAQGYAFVCATSDGRMCWVSPRLAAAGERRFEECLCVRACVRACVRERERFVGVLGRWSLCTRRTRMRHPTR